ncbi:hypothetical protein D3C81_668560 [compost metagenome]
MNELSLDDDIYWVELVYSDESCKVFRGTRNLDIIKSVRGKLPLTDIYSDDYKSLKENIIYDIKNDIFQEIEDQKIIISSKIPEFRRKVDKYANSYI